MCTGRMTDVQHPAREEPPLPAALRTSGAAVRGRVTAAGRGTTGPSGSPAAFPVRRGPAADGPRRCAGPLAAGGVTTPGGVLP